MQRGGKKSPFVGRVERIESASQLLYPRYRSLSDAILYPEGSVLPVALAQDSPGKPKQHASPMPSPSSAPQVAPVIVQNGAHPVPQIAQQPSLQQSTDSPNPSENAKLKPKKKKRKVKEDPVVKASGPSNAEEAQLIRSVLGFTATPPATNTTSPNHAAQPTPVPQTAAQPSQQPVHQQTQPSQLVQAQQVPTAQQQAQQPAQQAPQQSAHQPPQQAPLQPQQQATFKFGFAAESPAALNATSGGAAQVAPAAAAPQAAALLESLPAPPVGQAPSEYVARRVFVGGMPFSYEVDAIREYWSFCGEITDLDVMRFPDTGGFKGIAFITYATEEGYQEALKCDGTELDGQQLRVQKCMSAGQHVPKKKQMPAVTDVASPSQQQQQSPAPKIAGYHVAYVGNLAFEASDAEVQQLFPDCNVTKVRLHTDKTTGKSRGFAHVHFLDEASLDKALRFNGSPLHGRQVKVSYAQPKKGS